MNKTANLVWNYRWVMYLLVLFAGSVVFLLATPKVVSLTETNIFSLNQSSEAPKYLTNQPKPKVVTQITDSSIPPPFFTSNAVLAQDLDTGTILYQKNMNQRMSPASTTKIMTALVASEYFKPADVLTVPKEALVGGSTMGLVKGEQLTFRSLLYGMMLNSGNDAAYTIALNYPGGFDAFVLKMNQKAEELGLENTYFQNPAGFDGTNHYSSARDLALLSQVAIKNSQLSRIVSTKETSVLSWDKSKSHSLHNLNQLLSEAGVLGIKTGTTELAGENLVGLVERDNRKVLTVVLKSQNRFGETKSLIDWVYSNFKWNEVVQ